MRPHSASGARPFRACEKRGNGIRSTCPYCGVGCGVLATRSPAGAISIAGDPEHPANRGRLCSKGAALGETLSLDDRLLHPTVGGRRASWDAALDLVAGRFAATIAEHGPDAVAFYLSGQLLTEDYYVANKLMKGFIGSANIDTNSRLCMASSVAGHKRAFGSDTVPVCYEDLELADLVVLVGSNLAWCHPVLYQRLAAAKEARGTKVVVVDPRRTATSDIADLHLAIAPGTDVALFAGLLRAVVAAGATDHDYLARHTTGFAEACAAAQMLGTGEVARITDIAEADLLRFYDLFATTERVVTVYSQGVNQSTSGTDKVNAIINCHLATGRIGRPGMGPFSVTGQPNAMGGREVGGLANMLAAHMELGNAEHAKLVGDFWHAPRLATGQGLKAVDMFGAVADGRIKAIWIMATNPAVSMPAADEVRAALASCPFVVVSDVTGATDTARLAHVLLPSAAWGEKDGTVTNSERCISRQRAFLPTPGEAKADWWQLAEVARRMGFAAHFDYAAPAEIFAEHAALSGAGATRRRDFDISACESIDRHAYDALSPFQWPHPRGTAVARGSRFFADGGFFTPDRKARLVPVGYRKPAREASREHPLLLNTGRIRDQWHTMTRTGKTARLMAHIAEPFVEMNAGDAAAAGVEPAMLAAVEGADDRVIARVQISDRQAPGRVFMPMHWTSLWASRARVNTLVAAATDPVSGQPELKCGPVSVARFEAAWYGFATLARRPEPGACAYWALARAKAGWRLELAGAEAPADWTDFARALLGAEERMELLAYHDTARGQRRFALFAGDVVHALLYIAREPVSVARSWAVDQLGRIVDRPSDRLRLLAGRNGAEGGEAGATVCACFDVGANQIAQAVRSGRCATVGEIGTALRAGTNCGSCRSEIRRIVQANLALTAAV